LTRNLKSIAGIQQKFTSATEGKSSDDGIISVGRHGAVEYAAQYQQEHIAEGGSIFQREWFSHRFKVDPEGSSRPRSISKTGTST
jgi:hypothetical protein